MRSPRRAMLWLIAALFLQLTLPGLPAQAEPHGAGQPDLRARRCASAERLLARLEWWDAVDSAQGPFHWLQRLRRRAIRSVARAYADDCVTLNQVQVLGTHNSYHIQPVPELIDLYVQVDSDAVQWEYTHRPLIEQFELLGIRKIELDIYADPDGGLHASPFGYGVLQGDFTAQLPGMSEPGLKVIHVADLDYDSTCITFIACLGELKLWSDARPGHLPIMVLVEAKDESPLFIQSIPFGPEELDDIDAEIRSVFPADQLITPDDVRRGAPTLEEAVLTTGWPTLAESRGRILFAFDNAGLGSLYLEGHPSLEGRVLFTDSTPGNDDAAFVKVNDPLADPDRIPELVADGYIVRTRADANTLDARANDTTRRDAALESGAQFVSTDYPEPDPDFSEYRVEIPDGQPGRCNPVNAPPGCRNRFLER